MIAVALCVVAMAKIGPPTAGAVGAREAAAPEPGGPEEAGAAPVAGARRVEETLPGAMPLAATSTLPLRWPSRSPERGVRDRGPPQLLLALARHHPRPDQHREMPRVRRPGPGEQGVAGPGGRTLLGAAPPPGRDYRSVAGAAGVPGVAAWKKAADWPTG